MSQVKKGTISKKSNFQKVQNNEPITGDNGKPVKTATFDFSEGQPFISAKLGQLFAFILFVFGVGWFVAGQWVFQTEVTRLKYELKEDISRQLTEIETKVNSLKTLNPYLK